jgi:hypothetical protein
VSKETRFDNSIIEYFAKLNVKGRIRKKKKKNSGILIKGQRDILRRDMEY